VCFAGLVRDISVLAVGDGACSVVREFHGDDDPSNRTAIIDCGSRSPGAVSAAHLLRHHLSCADWRSLSELVITHFDADHWEGLLRLAEGAPPGSSDAPPRLPVYFPAVPFNVDRRLPASLMAFITAADHFGVQAMDLRASWRTLTRLEFRPLAKGARFPLAGRLHDVVWPPPYLDDQRTRRLDALVQQIDAEAELLAKQGHQRLQQSLSETYRNSPYNRHLDELNAADSRDFRNPFPLAEGEEEPWNVRPDDPSDPAIPSEWADRRGFKNLVRRARAAQNDLSLVFHDPERASLLVFGDAPLYVVERVSDELSSHTYKVALAPHHGSRKVPDNIPTAEFCVSQQGRLLQRCWHYHWKSHVNSGNCHNTLYDGPIVQPLL